MEAVRIRASPKQLSRLRNGHKVSVKPAMKGEGINLLIDPSQYDPITRSFAKGKGKVVQLSPEEIMANREIGGEGIFSTLKKGASSLAKSKIGKSLGKSAIDMAVASAGASGYVPPSVAKAIGNQAKSQVDGYGIFDTIKKGAKTLAKSKVGKSLAKTAIDTAVASAGASGYVPPSVAKAIGQQAKSQVDGYGIWTGGGGGSQGRGMCSHCGGCGLTAGNGITAGNGLYAGRARGQGIGMGGGALLGLANNQLPPALQSQNLSANFAFRNQMPPALAQMK